MPPLFALTPRTVADVRRRLQDGGSVGGRATTASRVSGVTWVKVTGSPDGAGWHPGVVSLDDRGVWQDLAAAVLVAAADGTALAVGHRYECTRTGDSGGTARFRTAPAPTSDPAAWHVPGHVSTADQILGDGDKTLPDRVTTNYDRAVDDTGKYALRVKGALYNPAGTGLYTPVLHPDDVVTVGAGCSGAGAYPLPFVAVGTFTIPYPVGANGQIVAPVFDDTAASPRDYGTGTPLCVSGYVVSPEFRMHTIDWGGTHDAYSYNSIFSAFGSVGASRVVVGNPRVASAVVGGFMVRGPIGFQGPLRSYAGGENMIGSGRNYWAGRTEDVAVTTPTGTRTLKFVNGVFVDPTAATDS